VKFAKDYNLTGILSTVCVALPRVTVPLVAREWQTLQT
jgi:hypothetical protein